MENPFSIITRSTASIGRLKDIALILARHGFGEVLDLVRLPFRRPRCETCETTGERNVWTKIRMAMEDLGPTFIKVGQVLSLRPDLVPLELCEELKHLQEDVHPEPFEEIRAHVERTYGMPLSDIFSFFDETPTAAASLSQVHRARLRHGPFAGRDMAVKVRRPRVLATVEADLDIMAYLAGVLHERVESLRAVNIPDVVAEVRKSLRRELDFINEARNIQLFRAMFADDPEITAPAVAEDWAISDVLIMEFMEGARLDKYDGPPEERERIAHAGLRCAVAQMLEHGMFHADPHLGNVRILSDGRLCYFDWGLVGRLSADMRQALVDYIIGLAQNDPVRVAKIALEMAVRVPPLLDFQRFVTDVMFVIDKVRAPVGGNANLGRFMLDLTEMCRDYGVLLRPDYILVGRALLSTEACGRVLAPGFDAMEALKPVAMRYAIKRASLIFSDKPLLGDLQDSLRALSRLPQKAAHVLELAQAGKLTVELRQGGLDRQMSNLRGVAYVIASGLVAASLVIGSSLIYVSGIGPHWRGMPIFGLSGFTISGLFGMWLVVHLMKKTK